MPGEHTMSGAAAHNTMPGKCILLYDRAGMSKTRRLHQLYTEIKSIKNHAEL